MYQLLIQWYQKTKEKKNGHQTLSEIYRLRARASYLIPRPNLKYFSSVNYKFYLVIILQTKIYLKLWFL